MLLQLSIETTEVAVFPGVPLITLASQALFYLLQQAFGLDQIGTDYGYFDNGAELEQVLLHQVLTPFASSEQRDDGTQPDQAVSRRSMHSNRSALMLMPNPLSSSRIQVGLVTLISVIKSPITSMPTNSRPRALNSGPTWSHNH